jgi:uncharacterized protein YbaR (Trm112 family)/ubiquinone/menaquinone biosynthesis C-methylase UbiE
LYGAVEFEVNLKEQLVSLLVCPECKGQLLCTVYQVDYNFSWNEIIEGCLTCESCGKEYPISGGIPRMLTGQLPKEVKTTVDGFGWEWQAFDEHINGTYMTEKVNFLDFISPVTPDFFAGKVVLDAGCGMGRFLKLGAEFGSQDIIGIDLSGSVDVAYRNVRHLPNAHVIQADILALPLKPKFDYIFSVGVLQFLEQPQAGFNCLSNLLRHEASISVWVYSKENNGWVMRLISPIRKHLTSRLPRPVLYGISYFLGFLLYLTINYIYKPANEIKFFRNLAHSLPYNNYIYYSSRLSYRGIVSIIFDHLVPNLVTYLSKEELRGWFSEEQFSDVTITSRNNMSWRAHAVYSPRLNLESA